MATSLLPLLLTVALVLARIDAHDDEDTQPQLIDLSHFIDENTTPNFPLTPTFNLTNIVHNIINNGTAVFDVNIYSMIEHGATHMDAPNHIRPVDDDSFASIGEVPLQNTVAPGVVIDCESESEADQNYLVPVSKILEWERANRRIPKGAAVLFKFGYSKYFVNNQTFYRGTDNLDDLLSYKYPSISEEAGRFLSEQRDMLIVGVDTISPDVPAINGELSTFPIHRMQFAKGRVIIENLNNLEALPPRGFLFSVAPAKFIGPTGLQVRAYAAILEEGRNRPHGPPPPPPPPPPPRHHRPWVYRGGYRFGRGGYGYPHGRKYGYGYGRH